jgi:hypothetical protein
VDSKLLLVKAITLLYRESLLPNRAENSSELIRLALEEIKVSDLNITINRERDVLIALKQTAIEMCENAMTHEYEKLDLLQRLRMNCGDDDALFESLAQGIEPELHVDSVKRSVVNIRKSIHNHFRDQKVEKTLNEASTAFKFHRDKITDVSAWVSKLVTELEPYQVSVAAKDPAVVSDIDIGDEEGVSKVFDEIRSTSSGDMILKTGLQDINGMLQGGIRRGDCGVIGALQHNFKTGFSLTLFKQIALYNKPWMIDPTKKPMLLRISFEDDTTLNVQFLYQSLKENETGEKVVLSDNLTDEQVREMANYVKKRLSATGYHVKLMRVNPSLWTYMHIQNKILELEAEGYEIHLCMADYLAMLPTTGCTQGPTGSDVRDMFRRIRNFCAPKKIAFVTPHQLSTEAKQLIREGRSHFVQEIANKGYYDKCKTIDQEVDWELYGHIEKYKGKAYYTIQRGKHRLPTTISDDRKYVVYQMHDVGTIRDDILTPNSNCFKVGGAPGGGKVVAEDSEWGF